jgi:hypothetical protein
MGAILLWICFVLSAIAGIVFCAIESDWSGLCQIVLVYFAVLFLEEKINHKK